MRPRPFCSMRQMDGRHADGGDLEELIPYVHACPLHRYGKAGGVRLRRIMVPSVEGGGLGVKNGPRPPGGEICRTVEKFSIRQGNFSYFIETFGTILLDKFQDSTCVFCLFMVICKQGTTKLRFFV